MPIVEVEGIGPVEFPEGTSEREIERALSMLPVPKSQSQVESGDWRDSVLGGFVRGIRDIPDAGAQMLLRGLEGLMPAGTEAEKFFQSERERVEAINRAAEQEYQQDWRGGDMTGRFDIGRAVGQMAGTAVPAFRAVQGAGALTSPLRAGGISGAVSSTLSQPVLEPTTGAEFARQKIEQAGSGAGMGAVGGYVFDKAGRVLFGPRAGVAAPAPQAPAQARADVTAQITPTAQVTGGAPTLGRVGPDPTSTLTAAQQAIMQRGRDMGFRLTPGQETGSRSLMQLEARAEANPFFSGPFNTIKAQNQSTLNRYVARSIGEDADELSAPVLGAAAQRIGDVFESVATNTPRQIDGSRLQRGIAALESKTAGVIPTSFSENALVRNVMDLAKAGVASGRDLQSLSSKLGKLAKKQLTTEAGDRDLGLALFQLKDLVDDQLAAGLNAADRAALNTAREQYRNLMTIEGGGVVNPSSGNVSGLNLARSLQRRDKAGFTRGRTSSDLYDAARFAQAFKPIVGDSGTATRMMEITPLNMLLSMPTNLAARAYTSMPTAIPQVATQGLASPFMNEQQRQLLRLLGPTAGGVGLSAGVLGK